jgi:membrane protease YdiL (CAAX protease family)
MTPQPEIEMSNPTPEPSLPSSKSSHTRLWLEVAVVLAVGVLPDLVNAAASTLDWGVAPREFWIDALALIQRSATVCAVALFLMWSSGDGWRRFGFVRWNWKADLPVVVVLFLAAMIASSYAYVAAAELFPPPEIAGWYFDRPSSKAEVLLLVAMSAANGFSEELVIWGFLFTRLSQLTGRSGLMVPVCAAIFASYHLYQGPAAMVSIFVIGLVYGVCFWRLRRLWPLVFVHAVWDVVAYLT